MDLDKKLEQKSNDIEPKAQETEAERVLRESLERGRQRAEASRMVSPWFVIGMMSIIVVTMIGLMLFVNQQLANKKPAGPSYKKPPVVKQEQPEDNFKPNLTKQSCLEGADICFNHPDDWTDDLTKNGNNEVLTFASKDKKSRLMVTIQPYIESSCDEQEKARIFERNTVAIRQLPLENIPNKSSAWARSFVRHNISGRPGDKGLQVGLYYPLLSLDNVTQDERKYAVVGDDQINGCQATEREQILAKDGKKMAINVAFSDQYFANINQQSDQSQEQGIAQPEGDLQVIYSPVSSRQKAIDFFKTKAGITMYEIIASAKPSQAKK